jgi:hypothetical protein
MITPTFIGFVTKKGVEYQKMGKYEVYKVNIRTNIKVKRGLMRTVVVCASFWGANYDYLEKYLAPYDQIAITGELRDVEIIPATKETEMDLIIMKVNGFTCSLPKREDVDGPNKSRIAQQRLETLRPDPAVDEDVAVEF